MTNGEKFKEVFKTSKVYEGILYAFAWLSKHAEVAEINIDWWNAEYKEPNSDIRLNRVENELNQDKNELESTAKNNLAVREFEEIEVTYPPEELCTYPEYKGKPYFGIKYKEKGEEIVGYGTYKPEVLSQYLKDYFISTAKNNLGVDAISRAEAKTEIEMNASRYTLAKERRGMGQVEWSDLLIKVSDAINIIRHLPPVTPQPRCKECKWWKDSDGKFRRGLGAESQCPLNTSTVYCGEGYCYMFSPKADMREVVEE